MQFNQNIINQNGIKEFKRIFGISYSDFVEKDKSDPETLLKLVLSRLPKYKHDIFTVPLHYGKKLACMRKPLNY